MGSLRDLMGSLAGEAVRAAVSGNGFSPMNGNGHGSGTRSRVESLCAELGWSIDERIGSNGIVLFFRDPLVRVRRITVSCGESHFVGITTYSGVTVSADDLPQAATGYLLHRNAELTIPAWQMNVSGGSNVSFTLSYCALIGGLTAPVFKTLCENMASEARTFDELMQQHGLL